ncbi:hypothetical protein [Stappia sp.]|uniref:hypothetical protein n=1 Tax=Stappia sp. TaxID=1870903 RepID=UPI003C7EC73A
MEKFKRWLLLSRPVSNLAGRIHQISGRIVSAEIDARGLFDPPHVNDAEAKSKRD